MYRGSSPGIYSIWKITERRKKKINMASILNLSENVILSIMMYIPLKNVLRLRLTCSYMYQD